MRCGTRKGHVQVNEWEIRSAKSGWKVIELLVERYGADKSTLFQVAAHRGDVDVLEAACALVLNEGHTCCDILNAAGAGDDALVVFKWLAKSKDTYFLRNLRNHLRGLIRLQEEFTTAFGNLCSSCDHRRGTAYMMNEPHALGYYYDRANLMGDDERRLYVIEAANGGAIKSLNFLCDRWGLELVTNYVILEKGLYSRHTQMTTIWIRCSVLIRSTMTKSNPGLMTSRQSHIIEQMWFRRRKSI